MHKGVTRRVKQEHFSVDCQREKEVSRFQVGQMGS